MWYIKHNQLLQHADSQYFLIDNDDDTESYIVNVIDAILSYDADVDDIISLNGPGGSMNIKEVYGTGIFLDHFIIKMYCLKA